MLPFGEGSQLRLVPTNYYRNSNKRGHLLADIDQHTRKTAVKRISDEGLSAVSGRAIGSLTCTFVQAYRPSSDAESEQKLTASVRLLGSCPQILS